ncbi:uncharacterized protein F4812DRAFT_275929 [Daldinia caldariorum]|uniref:uncharacterized protein n=1 Tax=Daldinia caldariorum TaxID=326644 RepID=UPI002007590D|nr:uncharacterized protein F4812DRAFT_275929 [Daldinia caldariorum]KAI1470717.1 hypothetical protein F4812DRAFT_275929 [Daldinia caldariorum]
MVSPVGTFFIILFVLLIVAAVGWIVFTQLRARRLGLPAPPLSSYIPFVHSKPSSSYGPPQPAPGGVRGWVNDKWRALRNSGNRSASGAYERPSRRGFGPLDPDEAWDSRVGNEADGYYPYGYEEQELGLRGQGQRLQHQQHEHNTNTGYNNVNLGADEPRGRTLSRDQGLSVGGNGNADLGVGRSRNPFDDESAEPSNISMRGVSPRPIDTNVAATRAMAGGKHDSPTSERRSIFREEV